MTYTSHGEMSSREARFPIQDTELKKKHFLVEDAIIPQFFVTRNERKPTTPHIHSPNPWLRYVTQKCSKNESAYKKTLPIKSSCDTAHTGASIFGSSVI